jgi:zinc transport system permease protein
MMVFAEISEFLLDIVGPTLETIAPYMPGEITPVVLGMEFFQRALIAAILATIVGGFFGSFLIMRNLALMGDGLAHVSFGGIAVGMVLGGVAPLWYALMFSTLAAVLIHEMQTRELLTGDPLQFS